MEQFRLEARTIAHLEHPHIVRILDFGIEGKTPFGDELRPHGDLTATSPERGRFTSDDDCIVRETNCLMPYSMLMMRS